MFTKQFYQYVSSYRTSSERLGVQFVSDKLELAHPSLEAVAKHMADGILQVGSPNTFVFGISGDLDSAVAALLLKKACLSCGGCKLESFYVQNEIQPARLRRIRRLVRYLNTDAAFVNLEVFDCKKTIETMAAVLEAPTNILKHGLVK